MATLHLRVRPTFPRVPLGPQLIRDLMEHAEEAAGMPRGTLRKPSRKQYIAYARFAVMKVASERRRSLPMIAQALGGMHHTSVLHGVRRAAELEKIDTEFCNLLWLLREVSY